MLIKKIPALRIKTAVEALNRKIYASLPWGYRVAQLMLKLSFSLTETLGRVVYTLFLNSGVQDMPPGAKPGSNGKFKPERLPRGYGLDFGKKIYNIVLKKTKSPITTEEILSDFMLNLVKHKDKISDKYTLRQAETYILGALKLTIASYYRDQNGREDRGQVKVKPTLIDDNNIFDTLNPSAFEHLDEMLPAHDLDLLLKELEDINAKAPSWLTSQIEGLSSTEIAERWNVSKGAVSQWETKYIPKIQEVVKDFIQDSN